MSSALVAPDPPSEPAELLRQAWASGGPAQSELDDLLRAASAPDFEGAAALIPDEAVAAAVTTPAGAAVAADARFAAAFPDIEGRADMRRLADKARRTGQAMGLLEAADGAAVAAWAVIGDRARAWARDAAQATALARPGAVLLLTFAPTRAGALAQAAVEAFGLTPLEARVAEAFLFAPTLEIAAEQAGVGRETARDAMERIVAKTGAGRSGGVVRRLTELMSAVRDQGPLTPQLLVQAFGLTSSEAEVAVRLVAGATQREAAAALSLSPETVRGYAKAALQKSGAARIKDLARVAAEAQSLARFREVAEPVFVSGGPPARLRLMPRGHGRNVAFLDYGPRSGEPAIVFHGFMAGRSLPPALVRGLQQRDCRPIVVQRPGFGLTTPALRNDYLETAANDLADVIDSLGLTRVALFARDGGTAAALAFASLNPDRIARAALLNPRSPHGLTADQRSGPVAQLTRLILATPQAIGPLGEFIRRRTRSDVLEKLLRETLKTLPQDLAALDQPAVKAQLVRDIQAQFAHSAAGYVAEHALYAEGWTPPPVAAGPWTIVHAGGLSTPPPREPWANLPGVRFVELPGAGVLAQFTHAEALAALIAGR